MSKSTTASSIISPTLALAGGRPVRQTPFPDRQPFGADDLKEVKEALDSQNLFYSANNKVAALEREFAAKYGVKFAVTSTSGTAAIHIAVAALGAEPGDQIITAPVTDFGSVAGMIFQGLVPVFADWGKDTLNMDPADIERKITRRTRAILVINLFGNPCDMDAIQAIARKHKLPIIEDCCQAFCTPYRGKWVGTIGDIGCFSFQQSKHLPTGDGGITITNNPKYAERLMLLRDKGWQNRGAAGARMYSLLALNYRMNEITAAVGRAQLRKVEGVVRAMNRLGNKLTELIKDVPGILTCPVTPGGEHSYWLYGFKVTGYDAKKFVDAVKAEGIPVGWGYTMQPIYLCADALAERKTFGESEYPFVPPVSDQVMEYKAGLCPNAERDLLQLCTLRVYENWSDQDITDIACAIRKVAIGLKPNA